MILPHSYFQNSNVVFLAKDLIGKVIYTKVNGETVGGIISETEAYAGVQDKASHAYNNKRTNRTGTMYLEGGHIYMYLCYGIHNMVNIVTNKKEIPDAVLIRSIQPYTNIEVLLKRRNTQKNNNNTFNGPGKVGQALALTTAHDAIILNNETIWIKDEGISLDPSKIKTTPRIGIDYAEEDALLPYRFIIDSKEFKI